MRKSCLASNHNEKAVLTYLTYKGYRKAVSSDFFLELLLLKSRGQVLLCYLMTAGSEANATTAGFIHMALFSNRALLRISVLL